MCKEGTSPLVPLHMPRLAPGWVELEGLEKIDFMIAIFEANKGERPFRSPSQALAPTSVFNTNFTDTYPKISSKQVVTFTADFQTGKVSNQDGGDYDKNMLSALYDYVVEGDQFKLDYKMETKGNLSITISIGDSKFTISGKSDGKDQLDLSTSIVGISKDNAAVVKAAGNGDNSLDTVVGNKQSGKDADSKQNEKIPFSKDDNGNTNIESNYRDANRNKFKNIPTKVNP